MTHRKSRREFQRTLTAYHEAGHAVAALALSETSALPGPYIKRVWVLPANEWPAEHLPDETVGMVESNAWSWVHRRTELRNDPDYRRGAWQDAVVALSGPAAEAKRRRVTSYLFNFMVATSWEQNQSQDMRATRIKTAIALGLDTEEAGVRDSDGIAEAAWDIVRRHWRAIDAVAKALLEQGCIFGEEVEQIVLTAMPAGFPRLRESLADGAYLTWSVAGRSARRPAGRRG